MFCRIVGGHDEWILRASIAGLAGILVNGVNADIMHFRFLWVGLALRGILINHSQKRYFNQAENHCL